MVGSGVIERPAYLERLATAVRRSPVTALLGPRQCGKTTLARLFARDRKATFFDLESQPDLRRLQNPELALRAERGLVVLDEIRITGASRGAPSRRFTTGTITTRRSGRGSRRGLGNWC